MIEINGNLGIQYLGKEITYEIACIYDDEFKLIMPSLSFIKNYGMIDSTEIECWDSDIYLKETLYEKVLKPWITDKTIDDGEEFAELLKIDGVKLDDFEGIYALFNKAFELKLL